MFRPLPSKPTQQGEIPMTCLRLILGDHLSHDISALSDLQTGDVVVMVEVAAEAEHVPHHKQKIVLILSAMRHFAAELRARGVTVGYVPLDDPANTHSFTSEVLRAVGRHSATSVVMTEASEWRVWAMVEAWPAILGVPVNVRPDTRFFCTLPEFAALATARKAERMEYFYREMRRRSGILMQDGAPVGGQWNYDVENRKALPKGTRPPNRLRFAPDAVTQDVITLVKARFPSAFGDLEPFGWPVTRVQALAALEDFITVALPKCEFSSDVIHVASSVL